MSEISEFDAKLLESIYYDVAEQVEQGISDILERYPTDKHQQTTLTLRLLAGVITHFAQALPGLTAEHVHHLTDSTFALIKSLRAGPTSGTIN